MLTYSSHLTLDGDPVHVAALSNELGKLIEGALRPVKKIIEGRVETSLSLWSSQAIVTHSPVDAEAELNLLLEKVADSLCAAHRTNVRIIGQVVMHTGDDDARGFYFEPKTVTAASRIGAALEMEISPRRSER